LVATQKENIRSGWENEEKIIDDVGEEINNTNTTNKEMQMIRITRIRKK